MKIIAALCRWAAGILYRLAMAMDPCAPYDVHAAAFQHVVDLAERPELQRCGYPPISLPAGDRCMIVGLEIADASLDSSQVP